MRQAEGPAKGKWTGDPSGGVKAPEPIALPDPSSRFARSAARLGSLSNEHPLGDWLRFMAQLMQAQHTVATTLDTFPDADPVVLAQTVAARMPPLAADGHRRDPIWLEGLALLLDAFGRATIPAPAREAIADLHRRSEAAREDLADRFLQGSLPEDDAGPVLYIAAALQVYFTGSAARLPVSSLRLLPQRGLCPCCGSTPVSGMVMASGSGRAPPRTRYLYCSLCSTAWNHVRATCITCGRSDAIALRGIEGDDGAVKAEVCDACHTYAKMMYQAQDMQLDPVADDLATLGLDLMVADAGWSRHAPNPLLLIGGSEPGSS